MYHEHGFLRRTAIATGKLAGLLLAVLFLFGCVEREAPNTENKAVPEGYQAPAAATLPDVTRLAAMAGPAVVNISTEKTIGGNGLSDFFQYFGGPGSPFEQFFRQLQPMLPQSRPRSVRSLGSGFVIDPSGLIVTNRHVVEGMDRIRVYLQGAAEDAQEEGYQARVVGVDTSSDVAVLRIDAGRSLPALSFGSSSALKVGAWVVAIGNPFGLDHTVTMGIVSAKGRTIDSNDTTRYIQTDASINPGNSGGPLINLQGQVVGINTAMVASGQGIGFAIPSDTARQAIERIRSRPGRVSSAPAPNETGHTTRPNAPSGSGRLGITSQDVDAATARALGLQGSHGVLVTSVIPNTAAYDAGIRRSDVIVAVNERPIRGSSELASIVQATRPGVRLTFIVFRSGAYYRVPVVIRDR